MTRKVKSEFRVFAKDGRVVKIEKWIFTIKPQKCVYLVERRVKKGVAEYHCKSDGADLWDANLESLLKCFTPRFTGKISKAFSRKNTTKQSLAEIFGRNVVFNEIFSADDKFKSRLRELAKAMK
ncbi:MAG: hypothetical protein V1928_02710 [Parcubacteria group bacterium]